MASNVYEQFLSSSESNQLPSVASDKEQAIGPSGEALNLPPNTNELNTYGAIPAPVTNAPKNPYAQFLDDNQTQTAPQATPQIAQQSSNPYDQFVQPVATAIPEQTAPIITFPADRPWYSTFGREAAAQTASSFIRQAEGFERAGAAPVTDISGVNAPFQRGATTSEATSAFDKAIADRNSALESLQGIVQKQGFSTAEYSGQISDLQREIQDLEAQKQQTLQRPEYAPEAQQQLLEERQQLGQEATQLEQQAESMFPYFDVSATDTSLPAQLGRGTGSVLGLAPAMLTGPMALPVMAIQGGSEAYAGGYNNRVQELKQQGVTDQKTLDLEGHKAGSQEAVNTIPSLAAYTIGGSLTAGATSALMKGASPVVRGLVGGTAAAGVNLGISGTMRAMQGQNFLPNVEQAVPDIAFGVLAGLHAGLAPSANPVVNEREAKINAAADAQAEVPLTPEQQKFRDDLTKRGDQYEELRKRLIKIVNQLQELPEDHPDRPKLREDARKISDQLKDLREGKSVDIQPEQPQGDERFKPKAQPPTPESTAPLPATGGELTANLVESGTELEAFGKETLAQLAEYYGIDVPKDASRGEIIDAINAKRTAEAAKKGLTEKPVETKATTNETTTKDQEQKTGGVSPEQGVAPEVKPEGEAETGTAQPQGEGEKVGGEGETTKTTEAELRSAMPNTAFFDEANEALQRLNKEDARGNKRQRFAPPSLQDLRELIGNPAYRLADKLAGIFGKKIVLYKGEEGTYINGATGADPALKDYIFLKVDGQRPHLFTAGHELWHHIELYSPVLANSLRMQITPLIKDWAGLEAKYKAAGYDKTRFFDEHIGDFMGDAMQDPKFWNDLAKKNPKSFKELATKTVDWLNKLLFQLKDWKMGGDFTKDIQKARDMLVDGLSKFAEGKDEPVSIPKEEEVKITIKRDKDFSFTGEYNVTIGDRKFKIFRDSETGYWRDAEKIGSKYGYFEGILSTENRAEAIEKLKEIVASEEGEGPMFQKDKEDLWEAPEQEISSAKTSRLQVPATAKLVDSYLGWEKGTINADIGGGKHNLFSNFLKSKGVKNLVFDPFNRTKAHNDAVAKQIKGGQADTATVNNVLNVIKEPENRSKVIAQAADAIKQDGTAYFITHEGSSEDRAIGSRETGDGWQNFKKTSEYIDEIKQHFGSVEQKGKLIIAKEPIKEKGPMFQQDKPEEKKLDEAHAKAIESGDMEEAQRLVIEAAKPKSKYSKSIFASLLWMNDDIVHDPEDFGESSEYIKSFLKSGKYYHDYVRREDLPWRPADSDPRQKEGLEKWQQKQIANIENIKSLEDVDKLPYYPDNDFSRDARQGVVDYANYWRNGDPATYDEQGKLIPLSERFNPEKKDIYFQQDRPTEQEASKKREEINTRFQAAPVRKTKNTIVNTFKRKPAKEAISYMRDAGDNAANIYAKENTNEVANDLKREFKKEKDKASEALSFVIEAKGDQAELANMKQKIANSPDANPAWKKKAITAIDFADKNFARLEPIADKYNQIGLHQVAQENANGIDTPVREGYVPHYQDLEEQELFGGAGTGSATGFRKMRTYDTFADSIANGIDPKSIDAVDLLQKRLSSGQKSINYRSWIDSLKQTIDPVSGDPIATKVSIVKRPDGSSYLQVPRGYKQETLAGQRVAIKDGYEGIISALNDPSAWSKNMTGQMIQKGAGLGKSLTLGLDTYHLGRIAIWESLIKSLGIKTFKLPVPSYRKGATLLDQSIPELQKMIANGEIPKSYAKGLLENKRLLNLAVKTGYNVGGISDSLHQDLVHSIPVLGGFNSWLFNSFQRGAMAETWLLEFQRYRNAYPKSSEADVARMVSKDLNTRFGNLGRQGILKSKTMQDTARFLFLAPQWNEGLIRTELGAMGQTGKALLDAATGKRLFAGVLARSVGGMVVAQFVANQLINYATRGTPTWENPEEGVGAKISAYIPDAWGGPGFFLNPMSLATETTHLLLKGYERTGDALETAMNYFRSRSSVPMRPVWDAVTNKNVLGTYYAPGQKWKGMLQDSIPYPIAGGAIYAAAREAITKEPNQQFAGQYQKQLFQTFGVKLEGAPSDESRVYTLANHFKLDNNIQDRMAGYSSPYSDLNRSLMIGNMTNAKNALTKILETKTPEQIKKYYKDTYPNMRLLESKEQQKEFLNSLSDEQRDVYDRAKDNRKDTSQKALDLLKDMQ
jgi:hypothetical protein